VRVVVAAAAKDQRAGAEIGRGLPTLAGPDSEAAFRLRSPYLVGLANPATNEFGQRWTETGKRNEQVYHL